MDNTNTHTENTANPDEDNVTNEEYFEIKIPLHLFQYLSAEDCDLQNVCRICLSLDNDVMFPMCTKEYNLLSDMFTSFTSLTAKVGDGLPSNICTSCQAQVVNCYDFKALCERSNYTLKSVLTSEFTTKDEVIDDNVNLQNSLKNKKEKETERQDVKEEQAIQDIQFLEDIDDNYNENEAVHSTSRKTKKDSKDKLASVFVIDSKSLDKANSDYGTSNNRRQNYYSCSLCGKNYKKLKVLRGHIKSAHQQPELPYACKLCKESFNSEHDLNLHSALHPKESTWKCNKCEKEFNSKSMLRRHIQRHMESKRYACETCGKLFIELYALRRHMRVHTGEIVEKKYECQLCNKRYRWRAQLSAHSCGAAGAGGARPCVCACGAAFRTPRLLASHARVHDDTKPHACRYCDKRFRHESTRNTHHRTHTGERPYVCSTCGKAFIQNSNLTLHMRTHTGEKPYSCSMCWRKFSSSSTLKAHQRIHTGERPYECNVCGKRFSRVPLRTHMRLHTGERPYHCSACPKTFINASRLREHAHVHTGERPFGCAMCTQMFPTKSHLVKHLKTHQPQKSKKMAVCNPEILVSNKIVNSGKTSTIEGLKAKTVNAEEAACRIVILDSEQSPLEVHLPC